MRATYLRSHYLPLLSLSQQKESVLKEMLDTTHPMLVMMCLIICLPLSCLCFYLGWKIIRKKGGVFNTSAAIALLLTGRFHPSKSSS